MKVIRKIKYPPKTGESEMTTMGSFLDSLPPFLFFPFSFLSKQQKPTFSVILNHFILF